MENKSWAGCKHLKAPQDMDLLIMVAELAVGLRFLSEPLDVRSHLWPPNSYTHHTYILAFSLKPLWFMAFSICDSASCIHICWLQLFSSFSSAAHHPQPSLIQMFSRILRTSGTFLCTSFMIHLQLCLWALTPKCFSRQNDPPKWCHPVISHEKTLRCSLDKMDMYRTAWK